MRQHQTHGFGPVYNENSRILILGSFPSVKSRAQNFYYGHPQNRFWKVIAALTGEPAPGATAEAAEAAATATPGTAGTATMMHGAHTSLVEARRSFVLRHGIALWDSIESCDIEGSSDASIRNIVPVNIARITDCCDIQLIVANGATAKKYYDKYLQAVTGMEAVKLPSTSPANAAWSLPRLIEEWGRVLGAHLR